MSKKLASNLMLLLTAAIWGSAFVAQSMGMDFIEPFTFNGIRNIVGGLALLPVLFFMRKKSGVKPAAGVTRQTWIGGLWCGVVLFIASSFQQFGLVEADAGKAGFITALYIVIVPICGLFFKKLVRPIVWLAVAIAAAGLYLLCIKQGASIERGDFLVLCCAFLFSAHILVIDHFSPKADGVMMSCIQFFVAGVLSLVCMALFESPTVPNILACWGPILYAGILSSGVGYTLQIVAQKNTSPTIASLLMSLESVFAAIAGWLILGESFSAREMIGVALMFGAIILAQLPEKKATPQSEAS